MRMLWHIFLFYFLVYFFTRGRCPRFGLANFLSDLFLVARFACRWRGEGPCNAHRLQPPPTSRALAPDGIFVWHPRNPHAMTKICGICVSLFSPPSLCMYFFFLSFQENHRPFIPLYTTFHTWPLEPWVEGFPPLYFVQDIKYVSHIPYPI